MNEQSEIQNYDKLVKIEKSLSKIALDQFGRERPDSRPVAPPVGYKKQPTMVDHVRALVARQLSELAAASGHESFEEANDFEVGEDSDPETAYEVAGYEGELGPLVPIPAQDPLNPDLKVWINPHTGERMSQQQFDAMAAEAGFVKPAGTPDQPPAAAPSSAPPSAAPAKS